MTSFFFVGPYRPIVCGIADYTRFINENIPFQRWPVLSFDLDKYGAPLDYSDGLPSEPVWRGIPGRTDISASVMIDGIRSMNGSSPNAALWFQHETAIWPDVERFVSMLRDLDRCKIVTFHTLHFQSPETPEGLRESQRELLGRVLPQAHAITVFTRGVHRAVTRAFPEYRDRIHLMRHGVHSYPQVTCLSRREAKERLLDYLLYESDLDEAAKEALNRERIFLDPNAILVGQTGFLCPSKQSERLYDVRDELQRMLPQKRIIALRIGSPRNSVQREYAQELRDEQGIDGKFLLELLLPAEVLPLAQRAFDINFYWPAECTQSGILAHALGAGAVIAGRDMEGVGETLREAGEIVEGDLGKLLAKISEVVINPETAQAIEERALAYADECSWTRQAWKHYELAAAVLHSLAGGAVRYPSLATHPIGSIVLGQDPYGSQIDPAWEMKARASA